VYGLILPAPHFLDGGNGKVALMGLHTLSRFMNPTVILKTDIPDKGLELATCPHRVRVLSAV
jgi:hypothetical protein